jgi:hypothetical protein
LILDLTAQTERGARKKKVGKMGKTKVVEGNMQVENKSLYRLQE